MFKKGRNIYLNKDYKKNLEFFQKELGADESFDVILREFSVDGKKSVLIGIDGFVKDDIITEVMWNLNNIEKGRIFSQDLKERLKNTIPYIELTTENQLDKLLYSVLSGSVLLIVDNVDQAFVIDARTYPARDPEEPELERVVRGSRDGFTETIVFNTALIRRRIRDPNLRVKLLQVGKRSKSDVCVCYIKDIADPNIVKDIIDKIEAIVIDAIPMAEKSVEELITPGSYWNPFPKVRYTERPDVAANHLFEGHILIIVDTSPSVMIAPVTYFHHLQHAEEYRQNPTVGVYVRWVRFFGVFASIFVTPLWLLFALSPELLPEALNFIGPEKVGKIPLFLQFLIADISLDLIRMAAIHTPSPLATALGVIAALLIGDLAVTIGLLIPEVIIYTAIVAIGGFSTPSYEMSMANRLARLFLLIATGLFKLPGFIVALVLILILLGFTKSFGVPYLWPLIPFNLRAMKSVLVRSPVPVQNIRPEILNPQDKIRQPSPALKRRR
ncbi:MAG TPA: spore germination protein [Syntrophomonadaceae bacterium]|nr:spore germination protein [Syntrophomonadaceae bacterium]